MHAAEIKTQFFEDITLQPVRTWPGLGNNFMWTLQDCSSAVKHIQHGCTTITNLKRSLCYHAGTSAAIVETQGSWRPGRAGDHWYYQSEAVLMTVARDDDRDSWPLTADGSTALNSVEGWKNTGNHYLRSVIVNSHRQRQRQLSTAPNAFHPPAENDDPSYSTCLKQIICYGTT